MSSLPWNERVYWSILMSRPLGSDTRTPFYTSQRVATNTTTTWLYSLSETPSSHFHSGRISTARVLVATPLSLHLGPSRCLLRLSAMQPRYPTVVSHKPFANPCPDFESNPRQSRLDKVSSLNSPRSCPLPY
jgi:hypothetical protein